MNEEKFVFYREILEALDISPNETNPKLNPKTADDLAYYNVKLKKY